MSSIVRVGMIGLLGLIGLAPAPLAAQTTLTATATGPTTVVLTWTVAGERNQVLGSADDRHRQFCQPQHTQDHRHHAVSPGRADVVGRLPECAA